MSFKRERGTKKDPRDRKAVLLKTRERENFEKKMESGTGVKEIKT